jgi:hypothetical protein
MKLNRKQKTALNVIRGTRGRFFGLKTTQGETLNAQFRGETESYIQIFDRNNGNHSSISQKLALTRFRLGSNEWFDSKISQELNFFSERPNHEKGLQENQKALY